MKFKITIGLLAVILLGVLIEVFAPFAPSEAQDEGTHAVERWAILQTLYHDTMPYLNTEFVGQTVELNTDLASFEQDPTLENLEVVQATWRETVITWEHMSILGIGRVMFIYGRVNSTPDEEKIADYLAGEDDLTPEFMGGIGSNARGLGTLETLIFPVDGDNETILAALQDNPRQLQYAVSLGIDLQANAEEIQSGWIAEAEDFGPEPTADQLALSFEEMSLRDVINELSGSLENLPHYRLGRPMGATSGGDPRPDLVSAWRSDSTIEQIIANLEGFKIIFNGDFDDHEGQSFADYLDFLEAEYEGESLAAAINQQIDICIEALQAIDEPLEDAVVNNPDQVNTAIEELNTLVRFFRADALSEMSIVQTFTDNDGD